MNTIPSDNSLPAAIQELGQKLYNSHHQYKEPALKHRRFRHRDIVPLIEQLQEKSLFEVQVAGHSVQGRSIYLIKAGTGKTRVLLWSQMHGDEPTATMALFDLLHFFSQSDELNPVRKHLLEHLTLYIVPMLNPDGAELYNRRNALGIDMNRDALRLQSPESVLLKKLRDELEPAFGFNLHDQSRYYTAGYTSRPATISFLAPAYDHARSINTVRERAMRTIAGMDHVLQQFIPGQVAKFNDEHEPRAFGDNIQKWGTSVILVESGGQHGDPEKQHIRQLNFTAILSGLYLIAGENYNAFVLEGYDRIPENQRHLYDLVLRHVRYSENGRDTLLDIGINRLEVDAPNHLGFYHSSAVEEIGDMSVFHGYEELDATGLTLVPGQVYEQPIESLDELTAELAAELLRQGYTTARVRHLPGVLPDPTSLPLNVTGIASTVNHQLALDEPANFLLKDSEGTAKYAILNGFLYDLQGDRPEIIHGLRY
ncbi:M14 family metallopeptidase [Pontibacter sp. BT731]|uniref:M14 family metallopeptidase n=1 Tax=Pontibacter coccineus TaxID=3063328 RepID=UPI0026E1AA83|nr:M14 metallopeptidase family protein [Pontibacter sp. BT731]MDO6391030.1 M14 family metallopeptidase [Pontibacter sp. BT731]